VIGALIALGISQDHAETYESKLRDGTILLCVHIADEAMRTRAGRTLERNSARDVTTIGEYEK
jgi:hypothetical protein